MNLVTLSSSGEVVQDTRNKLSDKSMVIQFFYDSKTVYWNGKVCCASMYQCIVRIERVGDEPR